MSWKFYAASLAVAADEKVSWVEEYHVFYCSNVSATPIGQMGLKMGVISIGQWGMFNHEKGAI